MFASFDIAHPILGFSSGLQSASLHFLSLSDRHFGAEMALASK